MLEAMAFHYTLLQHFQPITLFPYKREAFSQLENADMSSSISLSEGAVLLVTLPTVSTTPCQHRMQRQPIQMTSQTTLARFSSTRYKLDLTLKDASWSGEERGGLRGWWKVGAGAWALCLGLSRGGLRRGGGQGF